MTVVNNTDNGIYNTYIVQMGKRYAWIKPLKNKHIQLKELLKLFSHEELKEIITSKIETMWLFIIHKKMIISDYQ